MPRKRKHNRNVRSGQFWGLYVFFTAVIIALVVVGGSIVFFKVNNFDLRMRTTTGNVVCLQGNSRYTEEEIIEACGVNYGDNLCLVKKTSVANHLLKSLSYVSGVSVTRRLPGTLVITVTESRAAACVSSGEKWYIIDVNGKLLEESTQVQSCTQIKGLTLKDPEIGKVMEVHAAPSEDYDGDGQTLQCEALIRLLPALDGRELLGDITEIDLSSDSEITLRYQDRLTVLMLLDGDFDYEAKLLSSVLEDYISVNWSETDSGTLDMTYEDGQTHLTRDTQ